VNVDEAETQRLKEEWDRADIPVPLTVLASPYREITRPIVQYVKQLRRESPRDIVTVFIPEYVLGHWWEQLLHNQTALRLKARLLQMRGVVVASVPYQLSSATRQQEAAKSQLEAAKSKHGPPTPAARPGARPAAGIPGGTGPDGDSPPSPAQPNGSKDGPRAAGPAGPAPRFKPLSALRRLTAASDQLHAEELQEELQEEIHQVSAKPIADCDEREMADVAGTLRTVTLRPRGNSLTMEADLWDGSGSITLVWLGRRDIPGIRPGRKIVVHGRLTRIKGELTIYNPVYELRSSGTD